MDKTTIPPPTTVDDDVDEDTPPASKPSSSHATSRVSFQLPSSRVGSSMNNSENEDNDSIVESVGRKRRKRRRSKAKAMSKNWVESSSLSTDEQTDAEGGGGASDDDDPVDGKDEDDHLKAQSTQPVKGHGRKKKRKKRKHHSLPQPSRNGQRINSVNSYGSESDLCHHGHHSPQRSSVSDSEQFELVDEFRNLYASARLFEQPCGGLRPIVIDGCNVAWGHGNDQEFSYKGICLAADYFRSRGHQVKAFVPRQHQHLIKKEVVDELVRDEILVFTPSRNPGNLGKRITAYDDRFIVQYAVITGAIVISNDNFTDLWIEQPTWRETITNRVLQHTWVSKDILIFQIDPMGRRGQNLDEFLRFPAATTTDPSSSSSRPLSATSSQSSNDTS